MRAHQLSRALPIIVLAHTGIARAQSSPLTGSWERVSLRDSTGTVRQPPVPAAFAIYSANGYFAQLAIPAGRPTSDKPLAEMTKEELLARFERIGASRGTYTITGNRLTRRILSGVDPASEGTEFVQVFRIVGDTLILNPPNPASKAEARFVRVR